MDATRSSRRYKDEITPHQVDVAAVLALQPVTYRYKRDPESSGEFGLIAEDVDAAGLPEIVTRLGGEPDGIRYDLLSVALLAVVQDQHARLAALTTRLDALEVPTDGPGQ